MQGFKGIKRTGVAIAGVGLLAAAFAFPTSASATGDAEGPQYLIPTALPSGVIDGNPSGAYRTDGNPSAEVSQALLLLTLDHPELKVSGTEWSADSGQLLLYSAADESTVDAALEGSGLADSVEYRPAVLDASQKSELIQQVTGADGQLASGNQVVSVEPSLDGTTLTVVLDEEVAPQARLVQPDPELVELGEAAGVEVKVEFGPAIEPALRNHAANPSTFSGAAMHRLGTGLRCTTGWRMTQISGTVPVMGSAHHCFQGVEGDAWGYTTIAGYPTANAYSIYGAGMSAGDVAVWKGNLADQMLPGIFIGDHTVSGSGLYSVKGAVTSTVNGSVCYSGSYSGTVCNSTILATGITACYGSGLPCYNNLTRTQQVSGIPAAGSGDSGGPVYVTSNGIYAAGIISGVSNYSTNCTGEPGVGGRVCSATVLYAPITELMANGYGLNYIP